MHRIFHFLLLIATISAVSIVEFHQWLLPLFQDNELLTNLGARVVDPHFAYVSKANLRCLEHAARKIYENLGEMDVTPVMDLPVVMQDLFFIQTHFRIEDALSTTAAMCPDSAAQLREIGERLADSIWARICDHIDPDERWTGAWCLFVHDRLPKAFAFRLEE